jgi:hypothetical protein
MTASDKPRLVEIMPGAEYDYLLAHRGDIGTPLTYITDNRMYVIADSLATWRKLRESQNQSDAEQK